MNDTYRDDIHSRLNQMESAKLLQIWVNNDRMEWSDLAFEVLQEILEERNCLLPDQNEPISRSDLAISGRIWKKPDSIPTDDDPIFYQPREVKRIAKWLKIAAWVGLVFSPILGFSFLKNAQDFFWSSLSMNVSLRYLLWISTCMVYPVIVLTVGACLFLGLRGMGSILSLLMEMEFSSRVTPLVEAPTSVTPDES